MTTLDVEHTVVAPAVDVWAVLADFGVFLEWATGGVGSVEVSGDGIGMCRHLDIPGLGKVSERLEALDEEAMCLEYALLEAGPSGLQSYRARVQVVPLDANSCRVRWRGEFEPLDGTDESTVGAGLADAYQAMSAGLQDYASARVAK